MSAPRTLASVFALGILAMPTLARADIITLPPATQATGATDDGTPPFTSNSGTSSAAVEATSTPALDQASGPLGGFASATSSLAQTAFAQTTGATNAAARTQYDVEVVSPFSGAVPVNVSGSLQASLSQTVGLFTSSAFGGATNREDASQLFAGASLGIGHALSAVARTNGPLASIPFNDCAVSVGGIDAPVSCTVNQTAPGFSLDSDGNLVFTFSNSIILTFAVQVLLPVNTEIQVTLAASGQTEHSDQTAQALADPFFQIDPLFLANNPGISLDFSPGIENNPPGTGTPTGAVPEPATWSLLAAGLIGLGAMRRRRTLG